MGGCCPAVLDTGLETGSATGPDTVPETGPAEPDPDAINYADKEDLFRLMRQNHVQFVWPELFMELDAPLPKCQDVPAKYIVDFSAFREEDWDTLEVIAVSYCWVRADHPDPDGYHLATLREFFSKMREGSEERSKEKEYDFPGISFKLTGKDMEPEFCRGSADGRKVVVMMDWLGLPQDKPAGSRTTAQERLFKTALKTINVWYAHSHSRTVRLTSLPDDAERPSYDQSGWTTFEQCVSSILSAQSHQLCIDRDAREKLLGGWEEEDFLQVTLYTLDRQRGAPLDPAAFEQVIRSKTFTNGADMDAIVIPSYARTFVAVFPNAVELKFIGLGFGDAEARAVMAVAREHCVKGTLKRLSFNGNDDIAVPLEEFATFAEDFSLEELDLGLIANLHGDLQSVRTLTSLTVLRLFCTRVTGDLRSLQGLTSLTELSLSFTQVTGDLQSLQGLTSLTVLSLSFTQVTGDLQSLQGLTSLTVLYLFFTQVTGDLQSLQGLTSLTVLSLYRTQVTGDLQSLQGLTSLTLLYLHETYVTAPEGCPRNGAGDIRYPDAASAAEVIAWLRAQ